MTIDWQPLRDLVDRSQSFVLTTHMRPDCDALGSELALARALEKLGKRVRVVNADEVPPHVAFMDPERRIEVLGQHVEAEQLLAETDAMLVLDTSAWLQIGAMGQVLRSFTGPKLVIDHHVSSDDLGAVMLKETTSESNGRLVLAAIDALRVPLDDYMASALFAAMATDTGWFRFASVTSHTLASAARLVALGARPAAIFATLYERSTLARVQLHGRITSRIELAAGGLLAHSAAIADDFAVTGAELTDTEDVVNRLLTVDGVQVAALFVEVKPQRTKVSLRSRTDFDVRQVAEQFAGGGHNAAAGLRFDAPLVEARTQVLQALLAALGQH